MPEFAGELSLARPSAPILGDHSEGDPPVPIPNTEVKPLSPDGTARASVWERRKLPGISHGPTERSGLCVFVCVPLSLLRESARVRRGRKSVDDSLPFDGWPLEIDQKTENLSGGT